MLCLMICIALLTHIPHTHNMLKENICKHINQYKIYDFFTIGAVLNERFYHFQNRDFF